MSGSKSEWDDEPAAPRGDRQQALPFERWMTLSAAAVGMSAHERAQLLAEQGVDAAVFAAANQHWGEAIAADIQKGDLARARAFGERCADQLARRSSVQGSALAPQPVDTLDVTLPAVAASGAQPLPFVAGGVSSPAAAATSQPAARSKEAGLTQSLPHPVTDSPLPFSGVEHGVALTLEQYASFRAELGVHPERQADILAKYGLQDDAQRRALDEEWRRRFTADRAAQKAFVELGAKYRDWLLSQKGA